jgi:hypothetical protein
MFFLCYTSKVMNRYSHNQSTTLFAGAARGTAVIGGVMEQPDAGVSD